MKSRALSLYAVLLVVMTFSISACNNSPDISAAPALTVNFLGAGSGTVALTTQDSGSTDYRQDITEPFKAGETVELTASADDGSVFAGWDGDCNNDLSAPTCEVVMDADKDVRATFAKKTFTLTLEPEGTGTGQTRVVDADGQETLCRDTCEVVLSAGTPVTLTASADPGATFTSWGRDCVATGLTCKLTMDAAKTVTATFDRVGATSFDLVVTKTGTGTVSSTPGGISCGTDCRETYPKNTVVTLSAVPAASSTFKGWSGACSGTGSCTVTLSATRTVSALFDTQQVQLETTLTGTGTGSVTSSPAGINCPTTCTASFEEGIRVTLNATPAVGSSFSGWSGACTGMAACTLTLTSDQNVTASFTKTQVNLTVSLDGTGSVTSSPAGINCPATCTTSFDYGSTVTLTPTADSSFTGWSGACTGTACTLTLTSDQNVTASFANLVVTKTGSGSGRVSSTPVGIDCGTDCNGDFEEGTTVTLNAAANRGSVFSEWQNCPDVSGNVCRVTLSAAAQVSAVFAASGPEKTVTAIIARGTDDAEQYLKAVRVKREKPAGTYETFPANAVDTKSGDIDLTFESDVVTTNQIVGLRFSDLDIPPGATITDARIQFTVDHPTGGYVKLYLYGQTNPQAPTFVHQGVNNISSRPKTSAVVPWEPAPWRSVEGTVGDPAALTVNLAAIVQEVVDLPNWQQGKNGLAFIIEGDPANGTHRRRATSFEDSDTNAHLTVTYHY